MIKPLLFSLFILTSSSCFAQHKYIIKVKGNEISTDLSSRDYPNDSIAVTDGHLSQWDYYRTGNIVKVITTIPSPNYDFYFTVNTADSMDVVFEMINNNDSFTANVNWGDGTNDSYTSTDVTVQHIYSSVGDYKITITFTGSSNLTKFYMSSSMSQNITSIHNIDKLTQLDGLEVCGSKMANIDTLHYPENLRYIELYGSEVTSFNPDSLPPIIKVIDFTGSHNFTSITLPATLPSTLLGVEIGNCKLSTATVNSILTELDAKTTWALAIYLDGQTPPAPPSGAGLTAITSLTSKGCTITHD